MATNSTLTNSVGAASRPRSRLVPVYMPYLFLLPAIILLLLFRYYPAFSAVFHSFTDWDGTRQANFVGLDQYQALLKDAIFVKSIVNILIYTAVRTFLTTVMALIGAELVYNLRSYVSQGIWRIVFTIPLVIPSTVVFLVWRQIYNSRLGLLNQFLAAIGLGDQAQPWLGQPNTALAAIIMIGFPLVSGLGFLVLLSALQNLPTEVNDAALIDGCTRLRRIFAIDLPSIRGPLALIVILGINAGLQEFTPMLVVTNGGPINSTQSPGLYLYQQAFTLGKFGYSTAIGTVLMLMTLVFSVFILRARYKRAHDVEV